MDMDMVVTNKQQGIVSILNSDSETKPSKAAAAASLRRTLSADMSSKKWLSQNGFSPLKKIASSERLYPVSILDSSSEEEEEEEEDDIWASIQQEKKQQQQQQQQPGQFDIWSSILSQKAKEEPNSSQPPYIHPLVKRSASSLSEKSLEICTESLGSETGSDGFSSYPPSETGDVVAAVEEEIVMMAEDQDTNSNITSSSSSSLEEEVATTRTSSVKYDAAVVGKAGKLPNRSFPPPIPSLSNKEGATVRMKTHRDNGRLVLEAVSVTSQNNFLAQRQHGRLVLTFASPTATQQEEAEAEAEEAVKGEVVEELEEEFGNSEEEIDSSETSDEEEEEEGEIERCCPPPPTTTSTKLSSGPMNVHRLAVMMNKQPIWLANRNPTWPKNFDEIVKFGEEREEILVKEVEPTNPPLTQSLPPRALPGVARLIPPSPPSKAAAAAAAGGGGGASSFNPYEYYWRPKHQPMSAKASATVVNPLAQPQQSAPPLKDKDKVILSKNLMANNDQQQLLVLRGKKVDYFVPLSKGCKEPRRSLLFWEPYYCIPTSS